MKNILLLLTMILVVVVVVSAQETKPKAEQLTSKVWKIKNEVMSGVGTHTSLPKDTELTFSADGKWKSSQPIEGNTEGTWEVSDKVLTMTFSSDAKAKKYELISLNTTTLQYKIKLKTATYSFEWAAR
jgi:hypothetical protein